MASPLRIVDSHIHQWDPFSTPREASSLAPLYRLAPWLGDRLFPLATPQANRELAVTPRYVASRYLPTNLSSDMAGTPGRVQSVIHVEADWHRRRPLDAVDETSWVASLPFGVDGAPDLAAIVAYADPRDENVAAVLDGHLRASDKVRGIRMMGTHHDDPGVKDWIDGPGLYASPDFLRGFAHIADRTMTFDAYAYSHQLPDVVTLAREYPETTIVLDHYGPAVGSMGPRGQFTGYTAAHRDSIMQQWRDNISSVAAEPNVVAKHSGLAFSPWGFPHSTPLTTAQIYDLMGPVVSHTEHEFGCSRTLFGSNYPIDKPIASYATIVSALQELLDPATHQTVFADVARRVYRLDNDDAPPT